MVLLSLGRAFALGLLCHFLFLSRRGGLILFAIPSVAVGDAGVLVALLAIGASPMGCCPSVFWRGEEFPEPLTLVAALALFFHGARIKKPASSALAGELPITRQGGEKVSGCATVASHPSGAGAVSNSTARTDYSVPIYIVRGLSIATLIRIQTRVMTSPL